MAAYISILIGIIVFCIVVIVLNNYGTINDKVSDRLKSIASVKSELVEDEELSKPINERLLKPVLESVGKFFGKYVSVGEDTKKTEELRKMLRQAGITILPSEYNAIRLIVIIGTAGLFLVISLFMKINIFYKMLMPIFGAYGAFVIMKFNLASKIRKRKEDMERQMPDILDMLSVNVEAGLGFDQAMLQVINNYSGPLIDEMTIAYREMSMGRSRRDALQLLGSRCNIEELKNFTSAVIQAGKLGISLKNVLRAQASAIRQSRRSKVEEKAMKISVKMLIPMVVFIFPVIFIILMGPAVISIIEVFGGL